METLIDFDKHTVTPKLEEVDGDEEPGEFFRRALESIPAAKQDDGVFGLNVKIREIGNNNFYFYFVTLHITVLLLSGE